MMRNLTIILSIFALCLGITALVVWIVPLKNADHQRTATIYIDTVYKSKPVVNREVAMEQPISPGKTSPAPSRSALPEADLRTMARSNPFYNEAAKILEGKLEEKDADNRKMILNYCEHLRTAYTTKDIDFLRQVFSDKALIIVGNVVRTKDSNDVSGDEKVTYALHTKADYLKRLAVVFRINKKINVHFSGFRIMRHPTMDGIYGVTLRQRYKSDRYEDDGWLFLLWDFRNPSMPVIHVRTWQPAATLGGNDVIDLSDFNLN